jgi:hypothetical protein
VLFRSHDMSSPYYLVGELIGFPIVAYYFIRMYKNKALTSFIKHGRIEI